MDIRETSSSETILSDLMKDYDPFFFVFKSSKQKLPNQQKVFININFTEIYQT